MCSTKFLGYNLHIMFNRSPLLVSLVAHARKMYSSAASTYQTKSSSVVYMRGEKPMRSIADFVRRMSIDPLERRSWLVVDTLLR